MHVALFGASGRIGRRITTELLDRGHSVTGVSRNGKFGGIDHPAFEPAAADATDPDQVASIVVNHDAVGSALGPGDGEDTDVLVSMAEGVVAGMRDANVHRLVWTGGAGGLSVGPDTLLVDTEEFTDEWEALARSGIEAYEVIADAEDLEWTYIAPAAVIEPGERTGEYRTAEGKLVTDEEGDSYITMEDFAVAFVDELESGNRVGQYVGTGY